MNVPIRQSDIPMVTVAIEALSRVAKRASLARFGATFSWPVKSGVGWPVKVVQARNSNLPNHRMG